MFGLYLESLKCCDYLERQKASRSKYLFDMSVRDKIAAFQRQADEQSIEQASKSLILHRRIPAERT
jgi:hypothetical protein